MGGVLGTGIVLEAAADRERARTRVLQDQDAKQDRIVCCAACAGGATFECNRSADAKEGRDSRRRTGKAAHGYCGMLVSLSMNCSRTRMSAWISPRLSARALPGALLSEIAFDVVSMRISTSPAPGAEVPAVTSSRFGSAPME